MFAGPYILFGKLHQAAIDARRRNRRWTYLVWASLAGLCAGLSVAVAVAFVLGAIAGGVWWLALVMAPFLIVPPLAQALLRDVAAPAGWTRIAYYLGRATPLVKDAEATALVAGGWALARRPSSDGEAWLCVRRDRRTPLGDAEIITTALIAAGRGDADGARAMLRALPLVVEVHPLLRELAGEWLACDAVERGAWRDLVEDAAAGRWPASPLTFLLEGLAARQLGVAGAPRAPELWARWLLAPARAATWPLVVASAARRVDAAATATSTSTATAAPATPAAPDAAGHPDDTAVGRALAAHLELGRATPLTAATLAATVAAWDAALLDPATATWLAHRAVVLDAMPDAAAKVLAQVATAIAQDLATRAEHAGLAAVPGGGPVSQRVARHLRHGRLDALEAGFAAWQARKHEGAARAAIDEWREFVALRHAYLTAVAAGGLELRRLAFPRAHTAGTAIAAWLWNDRREYAVSHAISTWLLHEALAVGDAEAIDLQTRNVRLGVPTRFGTIRDDGRPPR